MSDRGTGPQKSGQVPPVISCPEDDHRFHQALGCVDRMFLHPDRSKAVPTPLKHRQGDGSDPPRAVGPFKGQFPAPAVKSEAFFHPAFTWVNTDKAADLQIV
ncbi:unnamed protein product [Allacma fusca]|uniref:Uncharacterized protein n=1 Tax=Allacma fusca TaxID=39272 RepID=A0A8J2JIN4_9HEXA|nr:unnamed protein product [Allacma fusca]